MKECKKCLNIKSIEDFYKDERNTDGLNTLCKECVKKNAKDYYDSKKNDPVFIASEKERWKKRFVSKSLVPRRLNKIEKVFGDNKMKNFYNQYPEKSKAYNASYRCFFKTKGVNFHHWSYLKENYLDVIKIPTKDHYKLHTLIYYDQKFMCYRSVNSKLLDTKRKHINYLKKIGVIIIPLNKNDFKNGKF